MRRRVQYKFCKKIISRARGRGRDAWAALIDIKSDSIVFKYKYCVYGWQESNFQISLFSRSNKATKTENFTQILMLISKSSIQYQKVLNCLIELAREMTIQIF